MIASERLSSISDWPQDACNTRHSLRPQTTKTEAIAEISTDCMQEQDLVLAQRNVVLLCLFCSKLSHCLRFQNLLI